MVILEDSRIPDLSSDVALFEILRATNAIRPFKSVFMFKYTCLAQEETRWMFAEPLELVNTDGFLDFLAPRSPRK